jgi:predicted nucleic acid-binding protein
MRLVVDTNVFVSAALKETSWPAETIRWIGRYGGLLKSTATEQELFTVLCRPRFAGKLPLYFGDLHT